MNKKILFLLLFSVFLLAPLVSNAAVVEFKDLITNVVNSLTGIGAGLATIAFIVAGIMFLSATGNPANMSKGKGALIAAVTGIVIIVLANMAEPFVKRFFGL